ncbi:hypothetical protein SAMN05216271_2211 [Halopseudomonas sabulinigri]|uniref:Cytochrome oxidase Cu insertion factor, SCO1/SenC/PrrC family n=2 Tax=Halopseudomonas sabulinigri TaxID=472181 RepID=A0A1H1T9W2_9GAMM|nr:hypothetical protein SAMN05216271_2211 [Halopseudomonas sabulinigri]
MMSMTDNPSSSRPRGQLKLLAICAVVFGPILVAGLMAHFNIGIPQTHSNKSDLVAAEIQLDDWQIALDPVGYGAPWRLVVTSPEACTEACLQLVHEARQINVAVGREADRVEHLLASGVGLSSRQQESLEARFPRLQQVTLSASAYNSSVQQLPASWQQGPQLWLIDPLGRVVLHQSAAAPGKHLLDDLKRLLKLSKVG